MASTVSDIFTKYVPKPVAPAAAPTKPANPVTVVQPTVQPKLTVVKTTTPSLSVAPQYPANFVGPIPFSKQATASDMSPIQVASPQVSDSITKLQNAPAKPFVPTPTQQTIEPAAKYAAVADIMSRYVPKVSGVDGTQAPAPTPEQPKGDSFVKSLIKEPIKALIAKPAVRATQAVIAAVGGEKGRAFAEKPQDISLPLLGNFHISSVKDGTKGIKQVAGESLEAAANLIPSAGASNVARNIVQNAVKRAVLVGITDGVISGAMFGAGTGLQEEGKSAKDIAIDAATSALVGGLVGGALSGGAAAVVNGIRGSKRVVQEFEQALIDQGVDPAQAKQLAMQGGFIGSSKDFAPGSKLTQQTMTEIDRLPKNAQSAAIKVKFQQALKSGDTKTMEAISQSLFGDAQRTERALAPKVTSVDKPRGFGVNVQTSLNTLPELAEKIDLNYTPITNAQTLQEANDLVARNVDDAIRVAKQARPTAKSVATAQVLIQKFQREGNFEQAIDLVETTAKKLTQSGQAVQAASMYSRLTPEGILRVAQRAIDTANDGLPKGKTPLKLKPDVAKKLTEQATDLAKLPEGSRERVVQTAKLLQTVADQVPASLAKKVSTLQTMAQLLNPKTIARNLIGNFGFTALENVSDVVATPLDKLTSIVTGKRTKSLPSLTTQASGFSKGLKEGLEDAWLGVDTSATASQFDLPNSKVFKGKIFGGLEKLLNTTLRAPDRANYEAAFQESIRNQLKTAKVATPTTEMLHQAHLDGLYRTFADESLPAKALVMVKRGLNVGKEFGLGDVLLKYPKTPGNLLARGIDYSPAGFLKTAMELTKPLLGRGFDQKKFVEATSRALVGTTGLVGTGALMHRLGILTGAQGSDKDVNALQRATGLGQYKINVSALKRFVLGGFNPDLAKLEPGDRLASYDWFQPAAIGLALGANVDDTYGSAKNKVVSGLTTMLSAFGAGLNTLGEQPVIQGITRPFKYSDSISDAALETLKGVPASFIPTLLSQIRQVADPTQRNTSDPAWEQETLNMAINKIPGLSKLLPKKYTGFGEELPYDQGLIGTFVSPAIMSKYATTPEQKMVLDIYQSSGETKQAPRIISESQTVNGESLRLSTKQQSEMQRVVGDFTRQRFGRLAQGEVKAFEKLTEEDKAKELAGIMTDINSAAKYVLLGNRPKRLTDRTKKYIREMKKQGVQKFDGIGEAGE